MDSEINITQPTHVSVLLNESINGLAIEPNGVYIDGTFGRGGHSKKILEKLNANGRLIAIDRDPSAIKYARENIKDNRFEIEQGDFSNLKYFVNERGLTGEIDGILLDLGVSSPQLDNAERGFSFSKDGPLDMRMNSNSGMTLKEWLSVASIEEIFYVLKNYGEEKFAYRIAKAIVAYRESDETPELENTLQLAQIIELATPKKDKNKHPATRSFQAFRIYINNELEEIKKVLNDSIDVLKKGGRLSVISFHSLEDRIVKQFIREKSRRKALPKGLPLTDDEVNSMTSKPLIKALSKAIKPSDEEILSNIRSRSSILRIAEKL
ncbi:16S rRNA (cytosine(1402)-N(4))-methyltransferase [Paraphotobacterium marinum]|uniref:Ribosomal RNA small subunit methyltransferase H n=1 Tax=Paraphotobacterium marinum TaxID=1755811 RepID=A0A220VEK9_9GAMM|nr:16S rRNA (cytosine(1402)-N(4))-methyltransferase [Paraphotobacterium marinum]